jgi:exonuclease SbcD
MNILHFADAHIGVTRFGSYDPHTGMNTRVQDFLRSLDLITGYIYEHNIDLVLFAGDAFHKRNPRSEYQIAFANRIVTMARHCPVVLLVGNHDTSRELRASALGVYNMFAGNIDVGDSYEVLNIPLTCGPIQIATFPYPVRRETREVVLEKLVELESQIDQDIPSILLAHLTVAGSMYGSEQSMAFREDSHIDPKDLENGPWNYVALGHLHRHQVVNTRHGPDAVYSGSIDRIDFGEPGKKGFVHISIVGPKTAWEFVELNVRPMHLLEIDLMDRLNKDYTEYVISVIEDYGPMILEDAIVRVKLKIKDTDMILVDRRRIEKELHYASHVSLVLDQQHTERKTRLGSSAHTLTDMELLGRYFTERIEDPTERAAIMEKAREIVEAVDEERKDA